MLKSGNAIKEFQKSLKPSNKDYIIFYFNAIYHNLFMREETPNVDIKEYNYRSGFNNTSQQNISEKGISFKIFRQYFDVQDFICERIFKYLDKSKSERLTKTEFVYGLYTIFFGNMKELYEFIFFLCDFNDKNKIKKINMQLILSYIPVETEEKQYEYIKHIRTVLSRYFADLVNQYKSLEIKIEQEIDYELYEKDIENHLDEEDKKEENLNSNGSLLLFLTLISYIYQYHPFIPENMNYCKYLNDSFLLKNNQNNQINQNNQNNQKQFKLKIPSPVKRNTKKFGTVHVKDNLFKLINNNQIKNEKINNVLPSLFNQKKENNLIFPKIDSSRSSNQAKSLTKNKKKGNLEVFNRNEKRRKSIISLKTELQLQNLINENNNNNNLLKMNNTIYQFGNELNNNGSLIERNIKHKSPVKQNRTKYILNCESIYSGNENNLVGESNVNNDDTYLLFKFCDEDNSRKIKKYYACLQGKDIFFFSSKLKNDLLVIWNICGAIINIGEKTVVNKFNLYPIKFTYFNGSYSIIYFEEKEKQIEFAEKCQESINFVKIEDLYDFSDIIGRGGFGVVKKCIEKETGKEYAVKIINKKKLKEKDFDLIIKERNFMSLIKHPNIVSIINDFEDEDNLYFVMEYLKGGDLSEYLKNILKKEKNLEKISAKIIKIIANAVQYLNNFGIVHRDIKPENIIFKQENEIKSIKLIDLGVAITLPYGNKETEQIGTLDFIAPEILLNNPYCHKVDVWSIGILLYYLVTGGFLPFEEKTDIEKLKKKIVFTYQEYPDQLFKDKSHSLKCLIDKALEKNPEKRININDFLKEEWLMKNSK
jgi:tRNA A-37 threonylcarbamoyl transferase component Bud32